MNRNASVRKSLKIAAFIYAAVLILVLPTVSLAAREDRDFIKPTHAEIQKEVSDINTAIKSKGAKWVADETSIERLSPAERKMRLGISLTPLPKGKRTQAPAPVSGAQDGAALASAPYGTLDWRDNGGNFVTPVRDQGSCGSCWAFGSTAALESKALITVNTPGMDLDLSEQAVISCSGDGSCGGGYLVDNFFVSTGVPVEACYPYTAANGNCSNSCPDWQLNAYRITGYTWVVPYGAQQTVDTLKTALSTYGPIVVTYAVFSDFYSYTSGIYSHASGTLAGYHAVLLVGYDDVNSCFIVKNSWGTGWGASGYFRIAYSEVTGDCDFGYEALAYNGAIAYLYSTITSPADGSYISGNNVTISGSAGAARGLDHVQVSTDNNTSWSNASGTSSWSFNWSPPSDGQYIISSKAADSQGRLEIPGQSITVHVDNTTRRDFCDDMETTPSSWTATGFWHQVQDGVSTYANSHSATHGWWYGQDATGDYNNGGVNSGSLVSAPFIVDNYHQLQFWSWEQTRGSSDYDTRSVYISADGGATWTSIYQSTDNSSAWHPVTVSLSRYAGKMAQLKFVFNTVNTPLNSYRGWYVDDVCITPNNSDLPATAITAPIDGSTIWGSTYTVYGTATDGIGPGIKLVEVSTDGGATWMPATDESGNGSWSKWSLLWTLQSSGSYNLITRGTDNLNVAETPGKGINVTVTTAPATGTIKTCGRNANGQLGIGNTTDKSTWQQVPGLSGFRDIAAGYSHTLALRSDGTVWAWGSNSNGQLGDNTIVDRNSPVQVHGLAGVVEVVGGETYSMALKSDGTVWTWGKNTYGQLGDGSTTDRKLPVQVTGLSDVKEIACGYLTSLALKNDGTVWTWGFNFNGELGNGSSDTSSHAIPQKVTGLEGVNSIAFDIALKTDGTAWAWGYNTGDANDPGRDTAGQVPDLTGLSAAVAGWYFKAVLKTDGTVWAWGNNDYNELGDGTNIFRSYPGQVLGVGGTGKLHNINRLSGCKYHMLAIRNDGSVTGWGYNAYGELGDGTTNNSRPTPVVSNLTGANRLATGELHSAAIIAPAPSTTITSPANGAQIDGESYTIAGTASGTNGVSYVEVSIDGGITWNRASGTSNWSYVWSLIGISPDGVYNIKSRAADSMGIMENPGAGVSVSVGNSIIYRNITLTTHPAVGGAITASPPSGPYQNGSQLSLSVVASPGFAFSGWSGDASGAASPLNITMDADKDVTANFNATVQSNVWTFGSNHDGQLCMDSFADNVYPTPARATALFGITSVCAYQYYGLALRTNGTVWGWGYNSRGQLGDGTVEARSTPAMVKGLGDVAALSPGCATSMAIKTDGSLWAWGSNGMGQLGIGTVDGITHCTPVQILSGVKAAAGADSHSVALKTDGTVWAWGDNYYGQLGDGSQTDHYTPGRVNGLTGVTAVAAGGWHTLALKSDGTVWAWGDNLYGAIGDGTTATRYSPVQVPGLNNVVAIAAAWYGSMALKSDGTVWVWGQNNNGQLGDGTATDRHSPVQLPGLSGVIAIARGENQGIGLKSDGTVWTWGANFYGELGLGYYDFVSHTPLKASNLSGVAAISAGSWFSVAMTPLIISVVTNPSGGAAVRGTSIQIAGTASESTGAGIKFVDVIINDGTTSATYRATDTSGNGSWATWSYSWPLPADGNFTIKSKATDNDDQAETPGTGISVTVDNTPPSVNAGGNKTAGSEFTQTASASDATSMTYQWTKQSGPGSIYFGSSTALTTTVSADTKGTYILRFTATDAAGNSGYSDMTLTWTVDGTPPGIPYLVKDINPGSGSSSPANLVSFNNALYFTASDGVNGTELWKSDGTSAGTVMVKDINPGSGSASPSYLTNVNGTLYFTAYNGTNGTELWKSDGTSAGTVMVKDIYAGSSSANPTGLTNVNGTLYFRANDGVNGTELWKSDGTSTGTVMVKDVNPGSGSASPSYLTNVNGKLYFSASDGVNGTELWKSDGTSTGTVMVKDINVGSSAYPASLTNVSGTLYFTATNSANGTELWKSDGTSTGTVIVKDINPGSSAAMPSYLTNVNGTLYCSANDGTNGTELWKSDGTSAGTVMVKDIYAGSGSANPSYLANINGTLYFAANNGTNGIELWKSDGTSAGTSLVYDINPGSLSSSPYLFTYVNRRLYFNAADITHGYELWAINFNKPPAFTGTPAITGTAKVGSTLGLTGTATSDPDGDTVTLSYQWKADGANIGANSATYTVTASEYNKSITCTITGDDGYGGTVSVTTAGVIVARDQTSTAVSSSLNPSVHGQSVTFTATISPSSATGTVTFKDGEMTLGTGSLSGGTVTYSTPAFSVGQHNITAVYGGDANYSTSTSSGLTQMVNQASTTSAIMASATPSLYSQLVTFTAIVSPSSATGTVTFNDGTTTLGTGTLSGGSAAYSTSLLSAGQHTISAVYGGDVNYSTSTSSGIIQTVTHIIAYGSPELPHFNWDPIMIQNGTDCTFCHVVPNQFLAPDFVQNPGFCQSCHNAAGNGHALGIYSSQGQHPMFANGTATGRRKPAFGSITSGQWNDILASRLKNGYQVMCVTCHNDMRKSDDPGRTWEYTTSSDYYKYYLQNGGWTGYGNLTPKVYRDTSLWSGPTYSKDKKNYLVDPSEYVYNEMSGFIRFKAQQATTSYIYATLYYPYLRAPMQDNALCSDCHTEATHEDINCLNCHQAHNTQNLMGIKQKVRASNYTSVTVSFLRYTGINSFADGDIIHDGICEVCHTQTKYYRRDGSGFANHSGGVNYDRQNCTNCHSHSTGFAR